MVGCTGTSNKSGKRMLAGKISRGQNHADTKQDICGAHLVSAFVALMRCILLPMQAWIAFPGL